ncbi:uncharacterized protein LOC110724216 [Chenopodium quinoa]|uniref:uncharacterized protein LOC110724216 n=1 Tax=Chenopodium quinoa TaxID=63459 RepID=UPI000B78CB92|nr:uncharacterized protein LOC110724216 [Chenopodium quinoa]
MTRSSCTVISFQLTPSNESLFIKERRLKASSGDLCEGDIGRSASPIESSPIPEFEAQHRPLPYPLSDPPSINCRIHSFGRICKKFEERRTRWVNEMGFGGILHLVSDMHLPRQLSYWIMTRIDPLNRILIAPDGHEFPLSKNQVRWILGTPSGNKYVPC